jgi:hypothetical protein
MDFLFAIILSQPIPFLATKIYNSHILFASFHKRSPPSLSLSLSLSLSAEIMAASAEKHRTILDVVKDMHHSPPDKQAEFMGELRRYGIAHVGSSNKDVSTCIP